MSIGPDKESLFMHKTVIIFLFILGHFPIILSYNVPLKHDTYNRVFSYGPQTKHYKMIALYVDKSMELFSK